LHETVGPFLREALERHRDRDASRTYDEALRAVAVRAAEAKSRGKADIGSLVMCKRITAQTTWLETSE
jgi:hypothetical protein